MLKERVLMTPPWIGWWEKKYESSSLLVLLLLSPLSLSLTPPSLLAVSSSLAVRVSLSLYLCFFVVFALCLLFSGVSLSSLCSSLFPRRLHGVGKDREGERKPVDQSLGVSRKEKGRDERRSSSFVHSSRLICESSEEQEEDTSVAFPLLRYLSIYFSICLSIYLSRSLWSSFLTWSCLLLLSSLGFRSLLCCSPHYCLSSFFWRGERIVTPS